MNLNSFQEYYNYISTFPAVNAIIKLHWDKHTNTIHYKENTNRTLITPQQYKTDTMLTSWETQQHPKDLHIPYLVPDTIPPQNLLTELDYDHHSQTYYCTIKDMAHDLESSKKSITDKLASFHTQMLSLENVIVNQNATTTSRYNKFVNQIQDTITEQIAFFQNELQTQTTLKTTNFTEQLDDITNTLYTNVWEHLYKLTDTATTQWHQTIAKL